MKNILAAFGKNIRKFIDFFYPPFQRFMTIQFFRYGVTGTLNLFFDWLLYFLIYNYLLQQQVLDLHFVTFSSHIGTLVLKLPIVLFTGFVLQKYVTFAQSVSKSRIQLIRYSIVFSINLIISFLGLKILVDIFNFWPTPSNMLVSVVTIFISYFSQKNYTFKSSPVP
jgi:putative flippase GtrA